MKAFETIEKLVAYSNLKQSYILHIIKRKWGVTLNEVPWVQQMFHIDDDLQSNTFWFIEMQGQ